MIAIVGRPNVGKSTLFNRLLRSRLAIVHDEPGVTRDRIYAPVQLGGRGVTLIDTGGLDPNARGGIRWKVGEQTKIAVSEADAVIFMADGADGLMPQDREVFEYLRKTNKKTVVAVNKIDSGRREAFAAEFFSLGAAEVFSISAEHGLGVKGLVDAVLGLLPPEDAGTTNAGGGGTRISFIGRPNVGKSSLINRLLDDHRLTVDEKPGTTRDAVEVPFAFGGRSFTLVDTAGIRRRRSVNEAVEKFSVVKALRSIENSEIALLVLDASEGISEQDARIAGYVCDRGRGLILVANKWDLAAGSGTERKSFESHLRIWMPFLGFAPLRFTSAKTGEGVNNLLPAVLAVEEEYRRRIPTGDLNRILEQILDGQSPPVCKGRSTRMYYMTQVATAPPKFMISTNYPADIRDSYRRYVRNSIRRLGGFRYSPVLVDFKKH